MRRNFLTKLTSLLLCFCMVLPLITACNNKESETTTGDPIIETKTLDWKSDGNYSAEVTFDKLSGKLKSFEKDDFALNASVASSDTTTISISEFTVESKGEKTISFSFRTPFINDDSVTYFLYSKTGLTDGNSQVGVFIYISEPQVNIKDVTYKGAYVGSTEIEVTIELENGTKYASLLSPSVFAVPATIGTIKTVDRDSDTCAKIVIGDLAENIASEYFYLTMSADCFDSEFAKDTDIVINYVQPNVTVSEVSYDNEKNILTVGKAKLSDGLSGIENGVSVPNDMFFSVQTQNYDAEDKSYSFSLKFTGDFANSEADSSTKKAIIESALETANVNLKLVSEYDEFEYTVNPYYVKARIVGNISIDADNDKIMISLEALSGTFADNLNINDFTFETEESSLTNFALESVGKDKVVLSADYTASITKSTTLSITLKNEKITAAYGNEDYSAVIFIPAYSDAKVDWAALGEDLATSAAGAIGAQVGEAVGNLVLPYVFEFLEIDTSDKDIEAIKSQLSELQTQMADLTREVKGVVENVKTESDKITLNNYQLNVLEKVSIDNNSIMDKTATVEYLREAKKVEKENSDNNTSVQAYNDYLEAQKSYEEFKNHAEEHGVTGLGVWSKDLPELYNAFVKLINKTNISKQLFDASFDGFYKKGGEDGSGYLDKDVVYEICKDAKLYNEIAKPEVVSEETEKAFIDAVGGINVSNSYIKEVSALGESIISTASGTGGGIISLYFKTVDTIYNFASQTITAKKAFVAQAYSNYLIGAGIAIQYLELKGGEESNLKKLRNQVVSVASAIESAYKQIAEIETMNKGGKDKILVSGQIVSRTMKALDVSDEDYYHNNMFSATKSWNAKVEFYTIEKMVERASSRGLSLAADMINAGFANVKPESSSASTKYVFASGCGERIDDDAGLKFSSMVKAFGSIFKISSDTKIFHLVTDLVQQTGNNASVTNRNATYNEWWAHLKSAYDSTTYSTKSNYKTVLFFAN